MFTLLEFSILFTNYAISLKLCDRMRFEVNCAKLHHRVISDGLSMGPVDPSVEISGKNTGLATIGNERVYRVL